MLLKKIPCSLAFASVALVLTTCTTVPDKRLIPSSTSATAPSTADINNALAAMASQATAQTSSYQIGPEDLLQVTLFNIPEAESRVTPRTVSVRVNQQAKITLPLLGDIEVKGMSVAALEKTLRERYEKYLVNPQVGVLVTEFRQRASVIGAVQKPGMVELTGPKTLVDVLALAGGLTDKASNQVHVYRNTPEGRQSYVIDLSFLSNTGGSSNSETVELASMPILVGDVVNVPLAGTVFIDGAVKTPGAFPLPRRYSLTQALTLAGGVDYELANYSGATIFRRRGPGEVDAIPANLNEILAGNAADPQIEPDDTIVIPVSSTKFFIKRFVGQIFSPNFSPFMFTGS